MTDPAFLVRTFPCFDCVYPNLQEKEKQKKNMDLSHEQLHPVTSHQARVDMRLVTIPQSMLEASLPQGAFQADSKTAKHGPLDFVTPVSMQVAAT